MQGFTQIAGVMIAEAGSGVIMNMYGFRIMGVVLGIIGFLTVILTPICERRFITAGYTSYHRLFESVKTTLTNRNFAYYLISYISVWFGINTLTITMPYITEVLMGAPPEYSGFMIAGAL